MKNIKLISFLLIAALLFFACSNSSNTSSRISFADVPTIKFTNVNEYNAENFNTMVDVSKLDVLEDMGIVDIEVGVYPSLSGGIIFLADALGFFEEENLRVTIKLHNEYASLVESFANNRVSVATLGLYETVKAALDGVDFSIVLPLLWRNISFMVNRNAYIENAIQNKTDAIRDIGGSVIEVDREVSNKVFIHYRLNGAELVEIINIDEYIRDIRNVKGKIIGLNIDSIEYFILNRTLFKRGGLTIDEVNPVFIPETPLKRELFRGNTHIGAFSEFNRFDLGTGNDVIFDSNEYKNHTIESLVFNRNFIRGRSKAIKKFINGWKKAIVFLEEHQEQALDIISDRTRLNIGRNMVLRLLQEDLIIPIMVDSNESGQNSIIAERNLIETYFSSTGIYTVESIELLNFITKNYPKYRNIEFHQKFREVTQKLNNGYYYNISFIKASGFERPSISYLKMDYAPQRIRLNDFNDIIDRISIIDREFLNSQYRPQGFYYNLNMGVTPEQDDRIVEILKRFNYSNFSTIYEATDRNKWAVNTQLIPFDYRSIDWDNIYAETDDDDLKIDKIDYYREDFVLGEQDIYFGDLP